MSSPRLPALFRLVTALALASSAEALLAADAVPAEDTPAAATPDAAVLPAVGARGGAAPGRGRGGPAAQPLPKMPTPPYLSAEESLKTMQLPPGYHLELVVSDPIVHEPVVSVFDGNGRMYVAEMRSYMQTPDSTVEGDERAPISRVSLHWSSKGDGVYDQHSVFVDNLVLPRMILPLKDSVLIQETHTGEVYEYRDTDGDGVADKKTLFHTFARAGDGNLEHQPSGLIWAEDNWIYSTYNPVRIRWTPKGAISEPTAANGGQWGIAQDNYGKTWVHNAGSNSGPRNFQTPIVYGAFSVPNQEAAGYKEVFPLVGLGDVQPGAQFLRADGTLNGTTSAAGIDIYRGDRLPADLQGDLLYGEPVGRLVRRTKIEVRDGLTYISNPYQAEKSEFIRSSDAYFRPVNMVTAPDGTIYITDMYRGIIQEGNWTRPGSFLRRAIDQYGIGEKVGRGRVWRLVYDGMKPGPQPHMLDETPAQLVTHLSHPNGWWRDTAQKLIILSQDKSVVPELQKLARMDPNPLTRIHAIWTLEGLDALDAALVREKLKDADLHVRTAAIRASETLYKNGDKSLATDIIAQTSDTTPPEVAIQGLLTAKLLKLPEAQSLAAKTSTGHPSAGVKELATQLAASFGSPFGPQFTAAQRTQLERGQATFLQLCFACHGLDGKGAPLAGKPGVTMAPPLAGSSTATGHRDGIIMAILNGLTGPVNGKTYEGQMIPLGANGDQYVADVASYIRNSFGNQASLISVDDVVRVRAANADRKTPWTLAEINARLPQPIGNREAWKFTSNRGVPGGAATVTAAPDPVKQIFTATAPVTGAWLQIELPEAATLSDIRVSSAVRPENFTRAYKVELSTDGQNWGEPVATGQGTGALVDISLPPTSTKWVRITHTEPPVIAPAGGGRGGRGAGGRGAAPAGLGGFGAGAPAAPANPLSIENLRTALTLTDAQAAQIEPLLAAINQGQQALTTAQNGASDSRNTALQQIGAILTDAQKPQLAVLAGQPANVQPGAQGRGGRGGPGAPAAPQLPPNWTVDDVQLFSPAPALAAAK